MLTVPCLHDQYCFVWVFVGLGFQKLVITIVEIFRQQTVNRVIGAAVGGGESRIPCLVEFSSAWVLYQFLRNPV